MNRIEVTARVLARPQLPRWSHTEGPQGRTAKTRNMGEKKVVSHDPSPATPLKPRHTIELSEAKVK